MEAPRLTSCSFGQKLISYLASNKNVEDVTFIAGSTGEEIFALKVALQAACPALDELFKHNWYKYWEKGNLRVPLPDVDPEAFRIFLEILLWDVLKAEEIQRLNMTPKTILHLVQISNKLQMAEINKLLSPLIQLQGHDDYLSTAGQLNSFDLLLRNKTQKPDSKNSCASGPYASTTGVHSEGSLSVAGNVITVIGTFGTSAHVPIFVPPVTHFYEIDPTTPSFTGRSNILTTIHSRMQVCSKNVNCVDRIVVLCGLGGIGKTEIARMYAKEFQAKQCIKNVAWIDADNHVCLKRSFDFVASVLNLSTNQTDNLEATVNRIYKHFSEHIGNGLFIFDDAPQFNDSEFQILKYLPTSESLQRRPLILITSREQVWDIPPGNKIIVHELTKDESVELFTKKLKLRLDQQCPNNRNAILNLADCFQGFPLGLSLAASNIDYLDESDLEDEIEEYLKQMEMPQGGWGEDTQSGAATTYNLVMKNVWQSTLKRIKAKERDGGDAIKLLNLMAFMPAENMTVDSMSDLFKFVFNKPVTIRAFAILKNKSMISIETLIKSSPTSAKLSKKQTPKIIRIHKLVQQCTRDNLKKDNAYFVLTGICNYVSNMMIEKDARHMTSALFCAHNHLKVRNWPQDSIIYSVLFCSIMIFFNKQNSDVLFQLTRDVYRKLNIDSKEHGDMQTEERAINLFCLCLIWINKHNDIYPDYKTLLHNPMLRKENFETAVVLFKKFKIELANSKTEKMTLNELQNYLYNHCHHTVYTLMAAEIKQRILNATSKALLKYRSIMESVMNDEIFKSDEILELTSKIAVIDAIGKFNSLCKPTKNNELTKNRAELTQNMQIIFREFKTINICKKEEAKKIVCLEVAKVCQSYADMIVAQTDYPLVSENKFKTLHAKITLKLTEEFKQTHIDSPLLYFALKHLTQQLNKRRLPVYQEIGLEYRNALDFANAVSAMALDSYKSKLEEFMCSNFIQVSNLHNDAKTAAIDILKNSTLIHPKVLRERLISLDSKIDSIYIQLICSLDNQNSRAHIKSTLLENTLVSTFSSSVAIGIDFGTSFCRVALLRHPYEDHNILKSDFALSIPSYVSYLLNQENSQNTGLQIYTGETAKQLASVNLENTVYDITRLIGRFNEQEGQTCRQLLPFQLVNVAGHCGVQIGDEEKLPQLIASDLLRHLKKTSEDFLRSPIDCAVVTIPIYYNEMQKRLTKWACHSAGFKNIRFIAEPVAAAVAYGIKSSYQSHEAKTCLIYDLGGGSFNVIVFQLDAKNRVEVKATGGDDNLGGEDFNDLLIEFCVNEFIRVHRVNLAEGKTSVNAEVRKKIAIKLLQIRNECEVQKCNLSSATMTSVVVSLDNVYGDLNLVVEVTRSKFEVLIQSLLSRSMKILDETLTKSGCERKEIDDVILIGGSSRIPKVQQMVQEYFAGKPIVKTIDADEAVACGAAVHAYNIFKDNNAPLLLVTLLQEICWGNKINGFPPRSEHAAVAVGNTIYAFGEDTYSVDLSYSRDVLDVFVLIVNEQEKEWKKLPTENRFLPLFSSFQNQRRGHSAVAHKECVLIFGGYDTKKEKKSNSTYRFNTKTLKWDKPKVTGKIPNARWYHSAVVFRNEMFVYGGDGKEMTNDLHSLHLESFSWSTIETKGIPPSVRSGHSATVHDDGFHTFLLIFGGHDSKERKTVNTILSFDFQKKTWTAVETHGTPPSSRKHHCAFVHNGLMYIFGGFNYPSYLQDVFSFNAETCEWRKVAPSGEAPSPRSRAGCVALNDQVFIFGGWNNDEGYLGDTNFLQM